MLHLKSEMRNDLLDSFVYVYALSYPEHQNAKFNFLIYI